MAKNMLHSAPLERNISRTVSGGSFKTFVCGKSNFPVSVCLVLPWELWIFLFPSSFYVKFFWHISIPFESRQLSVNEAGLLAPVLLVISMLMATPIFFHTRVHDPKFEEPWSHIVYCVEDWSGGSGDGEPEQRIYYSIFSMSMQYVIPFVSMALIYLKIFYYLKGSVVFA